MSAEPVAWRTYRVVTDDWKYHDFPYRLDLTCQPLYTRKRPLSDEEILETALAVAIKLGVTYMSNKELKETGVFELARAIEQAHGIGDNNE